MKDILFKLGSVNPCGISDVYYIPKEHIAKWPTIVDDIDEAADEEDYARYRGDFKLLSQKCWRQLYSTHGKGSISWNYEGETDCKVVVNNATLSYPKLTNEVRAFAKYAANGDFVFIIRHDGLYYVIGHEHYRATLTPNGASGDAPGSAKGVTIEITCPDTTPLPTYTGKIVLQDGILDCDTDTFKLYEDMNTNQSEDYTKRIEGGNTVRFEPIGKEGRIHLEGSGSIVVEVSVDGVNYTEVKHEVEFNKQGVAIAPFQFYLGDKVRISAKSLTKVKVNYNNLKN